MLLLPGLAFADARPAALAHDLRGLPAVRVAQAHGDARHDSLQRAPASRRADTLRPRPRSLARPPLRPADLARLQAARARWPADSLARLRACVRLANDFLALHRPDSAFYYLGRAWRLAGVRQRKQLPVEVIKLAHTIGIQHYWRGNYDSALYYYRQAARQFRVAGFDSSSVPSPATAQPAAISWLEEAPLAGILANTGSAYRALGRLPQALRYYERGRNLYQKQHILAGISWMQSLIGETYAAQGNYSQAEVAYEQALATARRYEQQLPAGVGAGVILADVLLNYYLPLVLEGHSRRSDADATALVAEATAMLQAGTSPAARRADPNVALLITGLSLVPAQLALQAGAPAKAAPWLARARAWLLHGVSAHTTTALWQGQDFAYTETRALTLGLTAWQQHAAQPERARRLLAEAVALLTQETPTSSQRKSCQKLAGFALAMGEPVVALTLLRPLRRSYQQLHSSLPLSQTTKQLAQAYARVDRYDSAYLYACRTQGITDTLRQAQQFAALAATEGRFRAREQATQIAHLTERERQQARLVRLAGAGAGLLALLALAISLAFYITRRLNRRLAVQTAQLHAQAERLGELDAAKNQFFANASHELRTPLTLVLAPLEGLLSNPAHKLPPAARAPVALAHRQARRLHELVNRILDLTRLQAGRLPVQPEPTAVAPFLRRVVASFAPLAAARGLALHGAEPLPEKLFLFFDADKVDQILTNLLGNALNHTPASGTVRLTAVLPAADGYYTLTVCDTGPGIAPAEQERVFERFYQSPQSQAQGGTGLGLALSRELAELLGGRLTLNSTPGQGAAFTLRFPAEVATDEQMQAQRDAVKAARFEDGEAEGTGRATATDAVAASPAYFSRPRVLVVEDQPDLREYLGELLSSTCEVLTAADGQEALELLSREAPVDLIATDAMMPRLSGTELVARLKADPARAGVPVLMLTARADSAHRRTALTVGVDDYLTKPFAPAELLARVRTLLARHDVRRQFAARPVEEVNEPAAVAVAALVAAETGGAEVLAPPPAGAGEQLEQWQARVAAHLADERFGPPELARLLAVSERTLYRRLGELAGLTPAAWLREMRLHRARLLLEAGGFGTVAAVAEAVGFGSARNFSDLYVERFGRRPSDYRPPRP
ncbi:ATP-binding protein [Hymenobacter convexus]|uniref:ATP-binding protein n=1 Tax=Hymenobacter sp. CA1UV-4 TaxID=3063782 RepID=UPI002713D4A1|nr:ATP-binding protein [Hymenobacter sp. CA1UV-4]MDO7854049.1 response regulator [Hymenobacter sp. CA1UV-4]